MNIRYSKLPLAVALALGLGVVAGPVQALGLGEIEVKSGLTQPLLAEIPILSASAEELESLDVHLASPEAFARVGLERPSGLSANLDIRVSRNLAGQPVVLITTRDKFNEPFLTFLLEASWGKSGVVREFSALVDPPYIAPAVIQPMEMPAIATPAPEPLIAPLPAPAVAEVVAETQGIEDAAPATVTLDSTPEPVRPPTPVVVPPAPAAVTPSAPVAVEPPPAPRVIAPSPPPPPRVVASPAPRPASTESQFGPVSRGQALWSIAAKVRPDASLTVNQMMLALQRANPEAFAGDNINRLKVGAVLRIPSANEVASVTAAEAAMLVASQAASWQGRVAATPQPAVASTAAASTPKPSAATAKPAATKPAADGRLAIVPPAQDSKVAKGSQSGASNVGGGTEVRAELVQTKAQLGQAKEDLATRQAEVRELKSRVTDLEAQQNDRQRLIDLQNSQLKAMQDRLAQLEAEKAAASTASQAPTAAAEPIVESSPETAVPAETPTAATPEPAVDAAAPVVAAPELATPAPADEAPWYINPLILGGIAGLGLLVLMLSRRGRAKVSPLPSRRISEDEAFVASVTTRAPETDADASNEAAAEQDASPEAAAIASEQPVPVPASAVPDDDEEQSELLAAVLLKPDDLDAHLALLRLYHARGDGFAYETAAAKMHGQVSNLSDARWRQAVVMGVALAPRNPLFAEAGWNTPRFSSAPAKPAATSDNNDWRNAPTLQRPVVPAHEQSEAAMSEPPVSEQALADELSALADSARFELPLDDEAPVELAPALSKHADFTAQDVVDDDVALDMALGLGGNADIHRVEAEVLAEDEGSATKIELAKAYLEIGDAEGAKAMLEEVVADAGPAAKAEAERLLREIG